MKARLIVSLELPEDTTREDAVSYVEDAVCSMKGGLSPEDPFFYLDTARVRVVRAPAKPHRKDP